MEIPKRALDTLQKAVDSGFWGDIEFKFQAGRIVLSRKTETETILPKYKENQNGNKEYRQQ
jgi:hypothetical protein